MSGSGRRAFEHPFAGVALAALAMSVGWGVRGDYGHEAGAMIPGALLGLAVCCASGREDWWRRAGIMGLCGALGWAFGGQMSYGVIVGYTAASSLPDVAYGYGSLFVVGGLWGGVGAGILALSITEPRSSLERFVRPLSVLWLVWLVLDISGATQMLEHRWDLNDTDWVAALSALMIAAVWPRFFPRDRSACVLIAVLAAGWWAGFLLLTALGRSRLSPPRDDGEETRLDALAPFFLLVIMMASNLRKNAQTWAREEHRSSAGHPEEPSKKTASGTGEPFGHSAAPVPSRALDTDRRCPPSGRPPLPGRRRLLRPHELLDHRSDLCASAPGSAQRRRAWARDGASDRGLTLASGASLLGFHRSRSFAGRSACVPHHRLPRGRAAWEATVDSPSGPRHRETRPTHRQGHSWITAQATTAENPELAMDSGLLNWIHGHSSPGLDVLFHFSHTIGT